MKKIGGLSDDVIHLRRDGSLSDAPGTSEIRFKETKVKDLKWRTDHSYLVKGLFPRTGLAIVWGPQKCGKSFWVLDVFLHVALGEEYRGRRVNRAHIVYLALEGQDGFDNRVAAFKQDTGTNADDDIAEFHLIKATIDLVREHEKLIADIKAQSIAPACVVIDTLNRSLIGSENDPKDMAAYLAASNAIQNAFGCLVVIVHHCGVNGERPRGHTSLSCAADVQIEVYKDEITKIFTATVQMAKDMPEGATLASKLHVVEGPCDRDGDPIMSCVVDPCDDVPASSKTRGPRSVPIAKIALVEALDEVGIIPPASNHIPAKTKVVTEDQWRQYAYLRGISDGGDRAKQKAFKAAFQHLVGSRKVAIWNDQILVGGMTNQVGEPKRTPIGRVRVRSPRIPQRTVREKFAQVRRFAYVDRRDRSALLT